MPHPTNQPSDTNPLMSNALFLVIVLVLIDSLHFVFGRALIPYLPPTAASFWYMLVATIEIAIFAAVRRQIDWRVLRDNLKFFLIIGFLIGSATAMSYVAVTYIDPGTASLVARINAVFGLGLGYFFLKERLGRSEWIGAVVAIVGVVIITFQTGGESGMLWLGALFVLASSFTYALHAAIVKKQGGDIDFLNFFLFRMIAATMFLFIFTVGRGELSWPKGADLWWILLLAGTVNVVIGRALYYIVLRRMRFSMLTIFLTLSPAATVLWSFVLFGKLPSLQSMVGGTVVIGGVLLVTLGRRKS